MDNGITSLYFHSEMILNIEVSFTFPHPAGPITSCAYRIFTDD